MLNKYKNVLKGREKRSWKLGNDMMMNSLTPFSFYLIVEEHSNLEM